MTLSSFGNSNHLVMAALVAAIHDLTARPRVWVAGTRLRLKASPWQVGLLWHAVALAKAASPAMVKVCGFDLKTHAA